MADFDEIIPYILAAEGGATITDDPADPGGLTRYGISQRAYPTVNIRSLTEAQAREIYRRDYWEKIRGDSIPDGRLALMVMDMAVNMGVPVAAQEFQRAINRIGADTITGWGSIAADGVIGPVTIQTLDLVAPAAVLRSLLRARIERYARIVQAKPTNARFIAGWVRRSFDAAGIA